MSAALFDLALRTRAAQRGGAVPRLLHNPCPVRAVQVAVCARRVGRVVRVEAVGPSGRRETGSGPAGLSALARAAGVADGNLGDGPTAIIDGHATLCALDALACSYADPGRSAGIDVAAGSALAGWWVERAAHPGTTAVCDVLAASRQRYVLGVPAGADTALLWRKTFGVPSGVAGMLDWQRAIGSGAMLEGLTMQRQDDDWLLGQYRRRSPSTAAGIAGKACIWQRCGSPHGATRRTCMRRRCSVTRCGGRGAFIPGTCATAR